MEHHALPSPPPHFDSDIARQGPRRKNNTTIIVVTLAVIVFVIFIVLVIIVAVWYSRRRTKNSMPECFYVDFSNIPEYNQGDPVTQEMLTKHLIRNRWGYATHALLSRAHQKGASWCSPGFMDPDHVTKLLRGFAWPNKEDHLVNKQESKYDCGATGLNYVAVPIISPEDGSAPISNLNKFTHLVKGMVAYGIKPAYSDVNPPGSILPFNSKKWSIHDPDPEPIDTDSPN